MKRPIYLTIIAFLAVAALSLTGCGSSDNFVFTNSNNPLAQGPTTLGFITQPSQRAGEPLTAFQVGVFDESGNLVDIDGVVVTITSPGNNLSGDLEQATVAGVANFNNVIPATAGSFNLVASAEGLVSGTSTQFLIDANDPNQATFPAPSDIQTGTNFDFSVTVVDAFGNPVPNATVDVEVLEVGTNNPIATTGTTQATTDSAGQAVFDSFSADAAGTAFLRITVGSLSLDSQAFTITAASAFLPAQNFPSGAFSASLAIADFDDDGDDDIAVGNIGSSTVRLFLSDGTGMFQTQDIALPAASEIAAGDLNGDDIADLVVTGTNNIISLINNGDATFTSFQTPTSGPSLQSEAVALGNLDADTNLDMVIVNNDGTMVSPQGPLSVFLGDGDGTFQAPTNSGGGYSFAALGDVNGDMALDILLSENMSSFADLLLGNGNGTFQASLQLDIGSNARSLLADLNNDGDDDMFSFNGPDGVSIRFSNGNGTFQTAQVVGQGFNPTRVIAVDIDGDTNLDLVGAGPSIPDTGDFAIVLLGNGDGTFQDVQSFPVGDNTPFAVAVGELNGDNNLDIVIANASGGNISILFGAGFP